MDDAISGFTPEAPDNLELVLFSTRYKTADFDRQPLPQDIFTAEKVIRAKKGQTVSKDRLSNSYILIEKKAGQPRDRGNTDSAPAPAVPLSPAGTLAMSDQYVEESADKIVARVDSVNFEPFPIVKSGIKKNIHQFKEIFEKNVANNTIQLNSKNNRVISQNIAEFLNGLLDNTLHGSDYIEMVNAIRTPDNYVTFSHPSAMAFYSLSIAKKLKMLREDFILNKNLGRWLPVKTKKNGKAGTAVSFSLQLLKYLDQQKSNTHLKFRTGDREELMEVNHDFMHEYASIDWSKSYPSMQIDYSRTNMLYIGMAALNADIGKMAIPNRILNKPEGLTEDERRIIETHPVQGINLLKGVQFDIPRVYAYILGHHRLSKDIGYPNFGNQPFPESKIIGITDIYDAMRSPKHYGDQRDQAEAFQSLEAFYKQGCFDLPLYIAARHTFHEFNHDLIKRRNRQSVEAE